MADKNTQYIEVSSNYRNRNLYPHPASFDVDISQTGIRNNLNALDPVSSAASLKYWNNSFRNDAANISVTINAVNVPVSFTDSKVLEVQATAGQLRTELNFYDGSVFTLTVGGVVCYRRIIWYEFLTTGGGNDTAVVWVESAFPNGVFGAGSFNSPTQNTTLTGTPQIFIPMGEDVDNFYINNYIQNLTAAEQSKIILYDAVTHMATLESKTTTNWATADQNFVIRREIPTLSSSFPDHNGNAYDLGSNAANISDFYVGAWLRSIAPAVGAPFSTPVAPYGENIRIVKYISLNTTLSSVTALTNQVVFAGGSTVDNYYVGCIMEDIAAGTSTLITAYVGETRTATLDAVTFEAPGDTIRISTAFTATAFTAVPVGTWYYELLQYTTDNAGVYNFMGNMIGQSEPVCYEIELINLILPNIILDTGRGGRIVFYPYVYVSLSNSVSRFAGQHLIWSNNPHSTRMLFRATVNDTSSPLITPFIRITGNGMRQTIKFKPNDNLHFSVHLPDGSLFSVDENESYGPNLANPLIQVSAIFSIRRV